MTVAIRDGRATVKPSTGGLATGLTGPHRESGGLWFGWPGDISEATPDQRTEIEARLASDRLVPIDLDREDLERYYHGLANGVLWPLFHYHQDSIPFDREDWNRYVAVNERFAQAVAAHHQPGDLVWVHDYHLALVPAMLRARIPGARIGFFLHIPFPSSEVFRIFPWRKSLLWGLLGADLIGFHTLGYMRHFLSSLTHVLGLDTDLDEVLLESRVVRCGAFPMGIDNAAFLRLSASAPVRRESDKLRRAAAGVRMVLGVDRLDYTKGIPRRLAAFERLLESSPEYRGHVQLLQIAAPSREKTPAYASFKRRLDEQVGRINGRFGTPSWTPIRYVYRGYGVERVVAFYRAADVMLVTPLRDGMNLVAKEFVASRDDLDGVLVISEFAGASEELAEAIQINPYDIDGAAAAIRAALEMDGDERSRRMGQLRDRVLRRDVHQWVMEFLDRLAVDRRRVAERESTPIPSDLLAAAERLLVFLDYDGTLVPLVDDPGAAVLDPALIEILGRLARRPGVDVEIVSGRTPEWLARMFATLPMGLHAEHGAWSRSPGSSEWRRNVPESAGFQGLLDRVRPVLASFARSHPGSFVEEKTTGLALHYRAAHSADAEPQAWELRRQLLDLLSNAPVSVLAGNNVIEIRPQGLHKGTIVPQVLAQAAAGAKILAIGDDRTDEDLFAALPENAITVRVGGGPTRAGWRLKGPDDVRALLAELAGWGEFGRVRSDSRRRDDELRRKDRGANSKAPVDAS